MPCPSQSSRFNHPAYIRWTVQTMKFLIVATIVIEHLNRILLYKSGPANKQHTNQIKILNIIISPIFHVMKPGGKFSSPTYWSRNGNFCDGDVTFSSEQLCEWLWSIMVIASYVANNGWGIRFPDEKIPLIWCLVCICLRTNEFLLYFFSLSSHLLCLSLRPIIHRWVVLDVVYHINFAIIIRILII